MNRSQSPGILSRRTMIRAAGIALGLPLLEAMTPAGRSAFADATMPGSPTRMATVFVPNGVILPKWRPTGEGSSWELSPTLQPLAKVKSKINVISGLALDGGRSHGDGAGDHARAGSSFLTAAHPVKTSSNIRVGISVDQVAAEQLRGITRLASIELGITKSRNAGACDSGYSCAYSSNISWRNESQPMAKEVVPRSVFERMFSTKQGAERREENMVRRSILDVVSADASKLNRHLGSTDRRKLDEYFTSVRELERRIEMTEREDAAAMPAIDVPHGRVDQFVDHCRLMSDLMVLGFQTDTTRVCTLMLDNAGGNRTYPEVDVPGAHHGLSHHRNDPKRVGELERIQQRSVTLHDTIQFFQQVGVLRDKVLIDPLQLAHAFRIIVW
ncbi:MAG: DUF1552 domain-containing protein [Planctomycetota bacterium]